MGLNSSPGNWLLITDHGLKGLLTSRSYTGLKRMLLVFIYEFNLVPSNLPADQAVVIQQLSIG